MEVERKKLNRKRRKIMLEKLKWQFLLELRLSKPLGLQIDLMKPDQRTRKKKDFFF
jgi:hypothetical protein